MVLHNPRYICVSILQRQKKTYIYIYIYKKKYIYSHRERERARIHFAPSYGFVSLHASMECSTGSTDTPDTTVAFLELGVVLVLYD